MEQAESNKKPSRQLERISQGLLIGVAFRLKNIFSDLPKAEQTKFKHAFERIDQMLEDSANELLTLTTPSPEEVVNCATKHIQEGLAHLEQDDYEEARSSFDQATKLLKIVDRMVM